MPRLPVDGKRVVEHRITLGQYEREQLDSVVTGVTFRNVANPMVALLSDVSALVALGGILEALGIVDITGWVKKNTWADEIIDGIGAGLYESYEAAMFALEQAAAAAEEAAEAAEGVAGAVEGAAKIVRTPIDLSVKAWVLLKTLDAKISLGGLKNVL
jgi:hypothetical protein